jgi:hypothetical protein
MKSKTKIDKIIIGVCIAVMIFFLLTIVVRTFTRQVLVKHYGISNSFTKIVLFDKENLKSTETTVDIDWEELYPFSDDKLKNNEVIEDNSDSNKIVSKLTNVTSSVSSIESKIETYTTDYLLMYNNMVDLYAYYRKSIGWNFASYGEYNGVVKLSDGYLTSYTEKIDVTEDSEALIDLDGYCQNKNIDFLYVQAPYKISEYDDTGISGTVDFSNQNADELLAQLDKKGIDYYDIRETIHENNLNNHELFYKTDHHWLTTTALWAAQNILSFCNDRYDLNADLSLLDSDNFDYVTYENWYLGSQGRKLTLARCEPDDFTLFYPKYETSFSYIVPDKGIDTVGDFLVTYDMSQVEKCDYYNLSPYHACNYGDRPLIQIENQLSVDDNKILLVHDSFSDPMISNLALAEKNVDAIDLRDFTGSLKSYIDESNPDLVIIMYNPSAIGNESLFDFR